MANEATSPGVWLKLRNGKVLSSADGRTNYEVVGTYAEHGRAAMAAACAAYKRVPQQGGARA
jgi:hypothetical protein